MNLEDIQPFVLNRLATAPSLAAIQAAGCILQDDGTYPKTPAREQKLSEKGLVLIVWEINSEGLLDVSQSGFVSHEIYVPVVVEENVKVNRATGGLQMPAAKALRLVLESLSGQRPSSHSPEVFLPLDPPFNNFGKVNGINRLLANLILKTTLSPA